MASQFYIKLHAVLLLIVACVSPVIGNGRLIEPVMRSSMWRFNSLAPINYNDHTLDCGGTQVQYRLNQGRCGVCGDPYSGARDNEDGGRYAKGIVARRYRSDGKVTMVVDLLAPKGGYFELKLCPREDPNMLVTQACFDNFPLKIKNGQGKRLWVKGNRNGDHGLYKLEVKLPAGISCSHCIIQWHYHTGDSWGANGGSCLGCGPQTDFYNCADVTIGYYGDQEASPNQPNDLSLGPLAERINIYQNGAYGTGVSSVVVNSGSSQSGFVDVDDLDDDDDDDDDFRPNRRRQSGFANLGFGSLFGGDDDDRFNFQGLLGGDDSFGGFLSGRNFRRRGQGLGQIQGRGNEGRADDDDDFEDTNYYNHKMPYSLPPLNYQDGKINKNTIEYGDDDDDDDEDDDDYRLIVRKKQSKDNLLKGLNDLAQNIQYNENRNYVNPNNGGGGYTGDSQGKNKNNLLNGLNDLALTFQNNKNSNNYNANNEAGGYTDDDRIPEFFKEADDDGYGGDDAKKNPTYTTTADNYKDTSLYTATNNGNDKADYGDNNLKTGTNNDEGYSNYNEDKKDYHETENEKHDDYNSNKEEAYKPKDETYDDPSSYQTPKDRTVIIDSGNLNSGEGHGPSQTYDDDYKTKNTYDKVKQNGDDGYSHDKKGYDEITSGASPKSTGDSGYTNDNNGYDKTSGGDGTAYDKGPHDTTNVGEDYSKDNSVYDNTPDKDGSSYDKGYVKANGDDGSSSSYDNTGADDGKQPKYAAPVYAHNQHTSNKPTGTKDTTGDDKKDVLKPRVRQRFDITNGLYSPMLPLMPHFGFGLHTNPLMGGIGQPAYPNNGHFSAFQAPSSLLGIGTPTANNLLPSSVNPAPYQNIPTNQQAAPATGGLFSWLPDIASVSNYGAAKSPIFGAQAASQYLSSAVSLQKSHPVTLCPRREQLICVATPSYRHIHNADSICTNKCQRGEACGEKYCACACQNRAHCVHQKSLKRLGQAAWKGVANNDDIWCTNQCNSGHCPNDICACNVF